MSKMIKNYIKIDTETYKKIYDFEKAIFGGYYLLCPTSFELFTKQRPIDRLCGTFCYDNNIIVSAMIFEKINDLHFHCVMIGTRKNYRNQGYFKLVCSETIHFLRDIKIKHFSLWSTEDNDIKNLVENYAKTINTKGKLTKLEIALKNELLSYWNEKKKNEIEANRKVLNFYAMKNGSMKSGLFWCFKII